RLDYLDGVASTPTSSGRDSSRPTAVRGHAIATPRATARATARAGRSTRAYSSIGQSPRLITGLFLVRIQVGLPTTTRLTVGNAAKTSSDLPQRSALPTRSIGTT